MTVGLSTIKRYAEEIVTGQPRLKFQGRENKWDGHRRVLNDIKRNNYNFHNNNERNLAYAQALLDAIAFIEETEKAPYRKGRVTFLNTHYEALKKAVEAEESRNARKEPLRQATAMPRKPGGKQNPKDKSIKEKAPQNHNNLPVSSERSEKEKEKEKEKESNEQDAGDNSVALFYEAKRYVDSIIKGTSIDFTTQGQDWDFYKQELDQFKDRNVNLTPNELVQAYAKKLRDAISFVEFHETSIEVSHVEAITGHHHALKLFVEAAKQIEASQKEQQPSVYESKKPVQDVPPKASRRVHFVDGDGSEENSSPARTRKTANNQSISFAVQQYRDQFIPIISYYRNTLINDTRWHYKYGFFGENLKVDKAGTLENLFISLREATSNRELKEVLISFYHQDGLLCSRSSYEILSKGQNFTTRYWGETLGIKTTTINLIDNFAKALDLDPSALKREAMASREAAAVNQ